MKSILVAVSLLACCLTVPAWSRLVPNLPFDVLADKADVIVILETIENRTVDDVFPAGVTGSGQPAENFEATNTRFKVHTFLKGGDAAKELTLLHFAYSTKVNVITNGASFIKFPVGPIEFEKPASPDEPGAKPTRVFRDAAIWLAFLKRRPDGRYEPVSGQYDASYSFRELTPVPAGYWYPKPK